MTSPLDQPEISTPELKPDQIDVPSMTAEKSKPLAIDYNPLSSSTQSKPSEDEEEEIHSLDVGEGNVVKLDRLGPMIVNSDGTLSRIQNWHELSKGEQERTVRLLVKKRNLVRLKKLNEEDKAQDKREEDQVLTALKEGE